MCRTAIGNVLEVGEGEVVVDLGGLRRRAMSLLVPGLEPGDLVLVGLGTVLGRVDAADRAVLDAIEPRPPAAVPIHPPHRPTP